MLCYLQKKTMSIYVNQLIFLCVLGITVPIDCREPCNGGATCLELQQCTVLYDEIRRISPNITSLLRGLRCGYNLNIPMICCPPEFLEDPERKKGDPASLLPDLNICGIQNDDRIIGGTQTHLEEHPWMALIRYESNNYFISGFNCAGVLINSRYVLTAAHCVKGPAFSSMTLTQVRLGEWNLSSAIDCSDVDCNLPPVNVAVEEIIPHEDFDPLHADQRNDIALLRLFKEVNFTDSVKPICLPTGQALRRNSFVGYDMEVAGWGLTELHTLSQIKLKVVMPVVKNGICQEIYKSINRTIYDTQICAGGVSGRDSCKGDSGGPLMGQVSTMNNWMAIGVVSYGPSPCGTAGWPGVYTRVTAYIDWILANLRP